MKRTNKLNRREFLAAVGAAASVPYLIPSDVLAKANRPGANDRIVTAHIGVGGMGGYHLRDMKKRMDNGEVKIAAVCDADENRLAGRNGSCRNSSTAPGRHRQNPWPGSASLGS